MENHGSKALESKILEIIKILQAEHPELTDIAAERLARQLAEKTVIQITPLDRPVIKPTWEQQQEHTVKIMPAIVRLYADSMNILPAKVREELKDKSPKRLSMARIMKIVKWQGMLKAATEGAFKEGKYPPIKEKYLDIDYGLNEGQGPRDFATRILKNYFRNIFKTKRINTHKLFRWYIKKYHPIWESPEDATK